MQHIREQLEKLNEHIYFDEQHFLREKTERLELVEDLITQVRRELMKTNDRDKRCFLYGTLGNLYRLKNEPKPAIECLEEAINLSDPNSLREMIMHIRLGEAYKYNDDHEKALECFEYAMLLGYEYEPQYLDFVFQHKGKCLMELGLYKEAMEAFQDAHAIRKGKKDEKLLQSTEQAMEFLNSLK